MMGAKRAPMYFTCLLNKSYLYIRLVRVYHIIVDVAYSEDKGRASIGVVIRDGRGKFIACQNKMLTFCS
jgi:hypothetical protein